MDALYNMWNDKSVDIPHHYTQGCPLDEHLPKVRAPGVQSPPGVRPHGAGPSRVQLLPPGTQSSLCPLGLKVKVNVTPRGGGEAWSQRDCPLQGLSSLLSACFLSWWENGGSDMVTSPAPITAGQRVRGGTVQATRDVASHLPSGGLQLGTRSPGGLSQLPKGG